MTLSVFPATTSALQAPSTSHLRSISAPTATPALPTQWHDGTTIVVAVVTAVAVLLVGLALLRRCCRLTDDENNRIASESVAASGSRESTNSDQKEPSWTVVFDQEQHRVIDAAKKRAAAKQRAAAKLATAPALAAFESAAAEERTPSPMWYEIATPTAGTCGKCGRAESDDHFVDATFFGMRCPACYGLLDSEEDSIDV
ncbi:Aste57867_8783 [Aphanomyces stellatus]|uniref:Aste57867_8783 protein n=1 Tax=Aphanomyces stellatus TaxID=120398 RepID=A0A485KL88_9STRA|nr:hypothetical protein As57867_008749 [Aphanomyces stellatus]VFT85669.1 Aste57867_8783 [Aphanomyces stellatus]